MKNNALKDKKSQITKLFRPYLAFCQIQINSNNLTDNQDRNIIRQDNEEHMDFNLRDESPLASSIEELIEEQNLNNTDIENDESEVSENSIEINITDEYFDLYEDES